MMIMIIIMIIMLNEIIFQIVEIDRSMSATERRRGEEEM
jgi:uncharacterized membrane protein YsdA (DUF1294 family)